MGNEGGMADHCVCEPTPASVREARLFVVDKLQEWGCDALVDRAALLTSELATNAVVHTGQPYTVGVARKPTGVRVEVADADPVLPHMHGPSGAEPGDTGVLDGPSPGADRLFSGLGMVDSVAARWGSDRASDAGKVVWFELDRDQHADGRSRLSDLSDLRSPEPVAGLGVDDPGQVGERPRAQEEHTMTRHLVDEDDRVLDERDDVRYVEIDGHRGSRAMRWILALLVIAALAIGAFFLLGGTADVDTKGDLEVPEVDVDVNAPDVNVDSEQAPPASADAGSEDSTTNG